MLKIKPYRNTNHIAWVRSKPCISCGCDFGIDAHHIIGVGISGTMGGKEDDSLTIPLCRICHQIKRGNMTLNPRYNRFRYEPY